MNKHEAIKFFGTQVKLAAALGIGQSTVAGWGDSPPGLRQFQIEKASAGALKADKSLLSAVSSIGKPMRKASTKNPNVNKPMGLTA